MLHSLLSARVTWPFCDLFPVWSLLSVGLIIMKVTLVSRGKKAGNSNQFCMVVFALPWKFSLTVFLLCLVRLSVSFPPCLSSCHFLSVSRSVSTPVSCLFSPWLPPPPPVPLRFCSPSYKISVLSSVSPLSHEQSVSRPLSIRPMSLPSNYPPISLLYPDVFSSPLFWSMSSPLSPHLDLSLSLSFPLSPLCFPLFLRSVSSPLSSLYTFSMNRRNIGSNPDLPSVHLFDLAWDLLPSSAVANGMACGTSAEPSFILMEHHAWQRSVEEALKIPQLAQ